MPPSSDSSHAIRVMTYNIHRWAGRDRQIDLARLAAVIRNARADVVGLNEVLHPVTCGRVTRELLCELADMLGMHCTFGPSGWVDEGPGWRGPVGNALLSRFPLESPSNIYLPCPPRTKQRSVLGARLAGGPARGLIGYVTHLDHAFEGTRMVQVAGVLRHIAEEGPHFVAGDFNTPGFMGRRSRSLLPPVLRLMRAAGYQDAFHVVGQGTGRTFPSVSPLWRIDFLFFPQRWAHGLSSAQAVGHEHIHDVSDHRPVVAEWAMPAR